jgi:hypothetical protein
MVGHDAFVGEKLEDVAFAAGCVLHLMHSASARVRTAGLGAKHKFVPSSRRCIRLWSQGLTPLGCGTRCSQCRTSPKSCVA